MTTRAQVYLTFAAALRAAGHAARVIEERPTHGMAASCTYDLEVDGTRLGIRFSAHERCSGGTFDSRPTGKFDVAVRLGSYADNDQKTHRFPERKDGTFDVERALEPLRLAVRQVDDEDRERRLKAANRDEVVALHHELGLDTLGMRNPFRVCESADPNRPVQVTLDVTLDMTAAGARRLFQALQLHGVPVARVKE